MILYDGEYPWREDQNNIFETFMGNNSSYRLKIVDLKKPDDNIFFLKPVIIIFSNIGNNFQGRYFWSFAKNVCKDFKINLKKNSLVKILRKTT